MHRKDNTSQHYDIQNPTWYLVSYHDINIIPLYCSVPTIANIEFDIKNTRVDMKSWSVVLADQIFDLDRKNISDMSQHICYILGPCYANIDSLALSKLFINLFFSSRFVFLWLSTTTSLLHGACSTWVTPFSILCPGSSVLSTRSPMTQVLSVRVCVCT